MLDRLFTPRRLRLYPLAALAGITIGFAFFLLTSDGLRTARGGRMGGDFPGFYGAARIVRAGTAQSLYDPAVQRRAQADLLPGVEEGWIHFAYPPFVALAYVPFTFLSFKSAYIVHTILMVLCCSVALALLRGALPTVGRHFVPCLAATLTFYPLFRANVGGQNTSMSLLCAAGAAAALAGGRPLIAGIWIGAWLFKPQLALPVAAIVAIRYPRVIPGIAIIAIAWYLLGAAVSGPAWPIWWLREGVFPFAAADLNVDRGNGVSFREVAAEIGVPVLGWVLILLTAALAVRGALSAKPHPVVLVGMAAAAAVLVAPHALFYDGGLAALGLAAAGDVVGAALIPYLAAAWIISALQPFREYLPLPPITVVLVAVLVFAARALNVADPGKPSDPPRTSA